MQTSQGLGITYQLRVIFNKTDLELLHFEGTTIKPNLAGSREGARQKCHPFQELGSGSAIKRQTAITKNQFANFTAWIKASQPRQGEPVIPIGVVETG